MVQIDEACRLTSKPSPSPEDRNKGGLRHRRQATDETLRQAVGFCLREEPDGAGTLNTKRANLKSSA